MIDRTLSLVVSLCLALLIWLYARSRDQEILDSVPLPVQITLGEGQGEHYNLEVNGPSQVLISFSGPPSRIRELRGMLQRGDLQVGVNLTVPVERLHESRYTETVHIEAGDIPTPPGVVPMPVEGRNRVSVTLYRLVERRLPVHFDPLPEESATTVMIDPPTVLVRGPQEVLDRAKFIPTQPSELPTRPATAFPTAPAVGRVSLVQELEGRAVRVVPNKVMVKVPPMAHKDYELTDVPVHFLCPANFLLRPRFFDDHEGKVTLRVRGPIQADPPRAYAFLDLTRGRYTQGLNHEPLQIQLPKDFVLAQEPPRVVTFELMPSDFVPFGIGDTPP